MFTQGDSFMKKDYVIVSKQVSTLGSLVGKGGTFSRADIADMESQPFAKRTGAFTPAQFQVSAAWVWRACSSLRRCSLSRCPMSLSTCGWKAGRIARTDGNPYYHSAQLPEPV